MSFMKTKKGLRSYILSVILILSLLLPMMPANAWADEGETNELFPVLEIKSYGNASTALDTHETPELLTDVIQKDYAVQSSSNRVEFKLKNALKPNQKVSIANREITTTDQKYTDDISNLGAGDDRTYTITVSGDQGGSRSYNINIHKNCNNARLSNIKIKYNDQTYSVPNFNPNNMIYNINVPDSVTSMDVSAFRQSTYAKAIINVGGEGTPVDQADPSLKNINLTGASTKIFINVKSEDGKENRVYALQINRVKNINTLKSANIVNSDTGAAINYGEFSPDTTSYNVEVDKAVKAIHFSTKSMDTNAKNVSIKVNGNNYVDSSLNGETKSKRIDLAENINYKVEITVEPQSGASKTYTYNILRRSISKAEDNRLDSLIVYRGGTASAANLNPSFSPETLSYVANLGGNYTTTTIVASAKINNAVVTISDGNQTISSFGTATATISGISANAKTISVTVKPEDTTKPARTYNVKVNSDPGDSNNYLSRLEIKKGDTSSSVTYNLMPTFNKDQSTYTVFVPYSTSSVSLKPTAEKPTTTQVTIDGYNTNSGAWSRDISLSVGDNNLNIISRSGSGDNRLYRVNVVRGVRDGGLNPNLKDMQIRSSTSTGNTTNVINFNPVFDGKTSSYNATIESSVAYLFLWAEDSSAHIYVNGTKVSSGSYYRINDIVAAGTKVNIKVISASGDEEKSYSLTLKKGTVSTETKLSSLTVNNASDNKLITFNPAFKNNIYSYETTIENDVKEIYITAKSDNKDASIAINGTLVNNGTKSHSIDVSKDVNNINIVVSAGGNSTIYSLKVLNPNATGTEIKLKIGSKTAIFNNTTQAMDVAPFTYKSRTFVPIRFVAEHLGANVDWVGSKQQVTIDYNNKSFSLVVEKTGPGLDVGPIKRNDRVFVPIRYVAEQLNCTVDWSSLNKEVTIKR